MTGRLGNYLSNELQKYYTRMGRRIVFLNGMTLNKLAWEMWEKLGYREIDPSVISRVLKGERIFDFKQLSVFANLIKIKGQEKKKLERALYEEMSSRYGLGEDFFKLRRGYLVDLSLEGLQGVILEKEKGIPVVALAIAEEIYNRIKSELPFPPTQNINVHY